jgi:YihY family inner membrane protein
VGQAQNNGNAHRVPALVFGLIGALVAGTTATGQLERALNRFYGVEQDRPSIRKYALAFALTITAGTLAVGAFTALAFGRALGNSLDNTAVSHAWNVLRWPLGLGLITAAITLLFRWCPRRRQPGLSWLAFGATISVLLWTAVTIGLSEFFSLSSSFGKTYGPLAGMVALLLWSLLSSIAVLYGAAVAAQLEAVRAGEQEPQDESKVERSEPEAQQQDRVPEREPSIAGAARS